MSDLKEFLKDNKFNTHEEFDDGSFEISWEESDYVHEKQFISIQDLGLFFWDRGGKQFVEDITMYMSSSSCDVPYPDFKETVNLAKKNLDSVYAQDFLDCLACLEKTKVKELIKELKEGVEK
jgi:hypothetical protein